MPSPNGKYEPFMVEYEQIRNANTAKLEYRRQEIYEKIPRIKELHDEIASGAVSYAKARLSGNSTDLPDLDSFLQNLHDEETALLLVNGYAADSFAPIYTCGRCRDTGFVDGEPCNCLQQKMIRTFYMQSNLQQKLNTENFDHFSFDYYSQDTDGVHAQSQYDYMHGVMNRVQKYVKDFPVEHGNLLFFGPTSLGKTYLSNCIAKALLDQGYPVLYTTATRLFEQLLPDVVIRHNASKEDQTQYEFLFHADLLILDDLGTEFINDFTKSQLYQIVNERLLAGRATIISTNRTLKQLRDYYDERLNARIVEHYTAIEFYGDNVRYKKKKMLLKH